MATDTPPATIAPIPASALATMTWSELWTCEDEAVATGDDAALAAVAEELRRRRLPGR